jgi:hypothetical protein
MHNYDGLIRNVVIKELKTIRIKKKRGPRKTRVIRVLVTIYEADMWGGDDE